jgi:hypothetical protein
MTVPHARNRNNAGDGRQEESQMISIRESNGLVGVPELRAALAAHREAGPPRPDAGRAEARGNNTFVNVYSGWSDCGHQGVRAGDGCLLLRSRGVLVSLLPA